MPAWSEVTTGINLSNAFIPGATFCPADSTINAIRSAGATMVRATKSAPGVTIFSAASNAWGSGVNNVAGPENCTVFNLT